MTIKTHTTLHKTLRPKAEFRVRGDIFITNNGNYPIDITVRVPVTLQDPPDTDTSCDNATRLS
jgi:hypothetical protein